MTTRAIVSHVNQYPSSSSSSHAGERFGVVCEGVNVLNSAPVAIKFESKNSEAPRLDNEYQSYRLSDDYPGQPKVHYFDQDGLQNVLVIDLLGPNLEELFDTCGRKFSIKTVCMLAVQMITRVQSVHDKNLVYRSIKPSNFIFGAPGTRNANLIYLIDFATAKHYRDPRLRTHVPNCEWKLPFGTPRYMSINAHLGREQSRRDDLECLGYVFVFFLRGRLPWQGLKADTIEQMNDNIGEKKRSTPIHELCEGLPVEFAIYMCYVRLLGFEETPDYDYLRSLFIELLNTLGETNDLRFDWMALDVGRGWEVENTPSALLTQAQTSPVIFKSNDDSSSLISNISVTPLFSSSEGVVSPPSSQPQQSQTVPVGGQPFFPYHLGSSHQSPHREHQLPPHHASAPIQHVQTHQEEGWGAEGAGEEELKVWGECGELTYKEERGKGLLRKEEDNGQLKIKEHERNRKEVEKELVSGEREEKQKWKGRLIEVCHRDEEGGRIHKEQEDQKMKRKFETEMEEIEEQSRITKGIVGRKWKRKGVEEVRIRSEKGRIRKDQERISGIEGVGERSRKIKEEEEHKRKGGRVEEVRVQSEGEKCIRKEEGERNRFHLKRHFREEGSRPRKEEDEKTVTAEPSALAIAMGLNTLDEVIYSKHIQSPRPDQNQGAQQDEFGYDCSLLLQFAEICREEPEISTPMEFMGVSGSETSEYRNDDRSRPMAPQTGVSDRPDVDLRIPFNRKPCGVFRIDGPAGSVSFSGGKPGVTRTTTQGCVDRLTNQPPKLGSNLRHCNSRGRQRRTGVAQNRNGISINGRARLPPSLELVAPLEVSARESDRCSSFPCEYSWRVLLDRHNILSLSGDVNDPLEIFGSIRDWINLPETVRQLHLWRSEESELLLSIIEHIINFIEQMKQESVESTDYISLCKSWIRKIIRKTGILPSSLTLKDVKLIEKNPVSCGGFADIYKGTYGGSPVAVKVIRTTATKATTKKYHSQVFHEALHWKDLSHEHIVSFLGIVQDSFAPRIGLVSPWMTNGCILQYLEDNPQANREALLTHSAKGLVYLHSRTPALVHGDIKAANVLVDDDGKARLIDFGLISISESEQFQTTSTMCESGSVRWMAPELIIPSQGEGTKSRTSDIYAFGMTILEVFTGAPPFSNIFKRDCQVSFAVVQGSRPARPKNESLVSPLSDELWEVVQRCWFTDPECRPSAEKLLFDLQALE